MFLLNFLQSLVIPKKMMRYQKMNILIAIAIFIISSGILALPNIIIITKNRYLLVDEQDSYNLQLFTKIATNDFLIIKNSSGTVKNQYLALSNPSLVKMGEPYIFDLTYQEKTVELYLVFDVYDYNDLEAKPLYNIQDEFNTLPKNEKDRYLIVFYPDGVYYSTPSFIKELKYAKGKDFAFSDLESGNELAYRLIDLFMDDIRLEISFRTFLIGVIYPIVLALIMSLLYKYQQSSYSFKEMVNLASISSILPLVVIVILAFIFPQYSIVGSYYIPLFGLYYISVLFLIAKQKKIA